MCFNPSPERRVPSPNRYMAFAKFCFCKNNKRTNQRTTKVNKTLHRMSVRTLNKMYLFSLVETNVQQTHLYIVRFTSVRVALELQNTS
jgi:hypothetical protein